jgi:hypothetical protein
MIEFKHDGLYIFYQRTFWKGYDGANAPGWNLEAKPFVA